MNDAQRRTKLINPALKAAGCENVLPVNHKSKFTNQNLSLIIKKK
jgi:hypothetical protein